jgi:hypothetical protein
MYIYDPTVTLSTSCIYIKPEAAMIMESTGTAKIRTDELQGEAAPICFCCRNNDADRVTRKGRFKVGIKY